ncbi:hypothetical protein DL96DRAFT_27223 [Flagelloscypha sp. PMI_526]|nr:hypothetical protein DL96DRAFT_27223 [Flagelloscypha sp. PMI_526]
MSASSSNLALEDGCVPTKVVIQLATQVVIPNYSRDFASIPLQDFKPSYLAMDDGSLLATPLISDFQGALLSLIILSVLLALFLRNVVVAGYYYFSRSKIIHDRRLFLALFLSQLVSPAGILPTMVSYFDRSGDCTVILRFERCIQFFSLSMLVYVVLGFKAYRVLEDSRAVLVVATILQLGATAVFGLELAGTEGHRRLSGSCNRNRIPITMVGSVSIQLAQVLFIAICFGIAILRARAETRGTTGEKRTPKPASPITKAAEKLGATGWLGQSAAQTPPRNSVVSRLTWVFPGMFDTLFHQVMRDELRFTCMIAVTSGVAIAFPLIGLNSKNGLSVQGWLCLPVFHLSRRHQNL